MISAVDLPLHEQILLLALHDEKGTVHTSHFAYALAGGIVAELLLGGRLSIEESKRSRLLTAADAWPTGDPLLDECVHRIADAKRKASTATWVGRLAALRDLQHRVAERLCERGILRREEGRVLWLFSRTLYPTADPTPERALVAAMRSAIAEEREVPARLAIVLALAHSSGILRHVLDGELLKTRRERLETLVRLDEASGATRSAIEAARAAMAAVTAATTAASIAHAR
jgi:golgi phosphoprotein 3